ncbi:hypothetical protein, partial [Shewanella algae]|uniref:hypothetical protein n=1 Tax=Shewanella algae TaxID=38313 RepID=UPI00313DD3FE
MAQDSVSTNRLGSDASAQSTAIVQQANPGWLGEPMSWINASDSTTFGIEFNSAALPISSDTDGFSSPRA